MGDDININELINIADSINQNTIENKKKEKEDRINTDKFIMMKFKISRKRFSKLIKGTSIKYNPKSHMYDVPETINDSKLNDNKLLINDSELSLSNSNNFVSGTSNDDNLPEIKTDEIKKIIEKEYPELLEIIDLYRKNNTNIVEKSSKEININRPELKGELFSKSFKTYKKVIDDFVKFSSKRVETQKDLIAIALLEFMEKYS